MVDSILKMNTINIDLETLGVNPNKSDIYSGAVYTTNNGAESISQSFFNIRNNKIQLSSKEDYEELLEKSHDSLKFGKEQRERKSLLGWAEKAYENNLDSLPTYVKNILKHSEQTEDGSILLAQNLQFESRALTAAYRKGTLGKEYTDLYSKLVNKGEADSNSMLVPREIADESLSRGLMVRDDLRHALNSGDKDLIQTTLDEYDSKSRNILDMYKRDIAKAKSINGIATVDLMDYSKAIYAHGARTGQFDPRLLMYGNSIEFLSKTLLKEEEKHEALSDAKQQSQLFKRFNEELSIIREKGDTYQSPMIKELSEGFTKYKVAENQVKRSASSFVREYIEGGKDVSELKDKVLGTFSYKHRALGDTKDIAGFNYDSFKREFSKVLETTENKGTVQDYIQQLETNIQNIENKAPSKKTSELLADLMPKSKRSKYILGGVTAIAGLNLLIGGKDKKESKYTTYDQLYNNQYYGSSFADWEERNNSHRML